MSQQSPTSAMLSAGLTGNPYLARYRAGAAAQDSNMRASLQTPETQPSPARLWTISTTPPAKAFTSGVFPPPLDDDIQLCDDLLAELQTDLLSVPTATFSSKFSTRATVCFL